MSGEEREALLRAVVLGERSLDDPEVVAAAAQDAAFAAELESMHSVVESLEAAGVLREVEREARRTPPGPRASPSSSPAPSRRWLVLAALAAAAALAVLVWRPWRPSADADPYLGGDHVRIVYPVDGVASGYERFAWELPSGLSRVRVTVFDAASGEERDKEFTTGLEWRPAPERHALWPDAIELEVQPIDDSDWPVGRPDRRRTLRAPR